MPAVQSGSNANSYALVIGGVSYLGSADVSSIRWSESGAEAPAQLFCTLELAALTNQDFPGQEIALRDLTNSRKLFGGIVMSAKRYHGVGPVVYYDIEADSYDCLLDRYSIVRWRSVVNITAKRVRAMATDREMIQSLAAAGYLYDLTANNSNVASTNGSMPKLTLTSLTARDALQNIAEAASSFTDQTARRFYVDFDKNLHYYKASEGTSAPYRIGNASYTGVIKATSGLVSLWAMREASGATAYDAQSYANVTLAGAYTRNVTALTANEPAMRSTTLSSTGYGSASGANLHQADGPWSFECWFTRTSNGAQMALWSGGSTDVLIGFDGSDHIRVQKEGTGDNFVTDATYGNDTTYHLVVSRPSGGPTAVYVNGVSKSGTTTGRTFASAAGAINIGRKLSTTDQLFSGTLNHVAWYSSALSEATALAHYRAGITVVPDYIDFEKDVTDTAKKVYIKGGNKAGTDWFVWGTGRQYDRVDIVDQPESDSNAAAKAFASAYKNREGAVVTGGRFEVTGYDGWRAGQTVAVADTGLGISDNYEIREIEAYPNMGNGKTTYRIAYGTLPYRATQMLTRKKKAIESTGKRSGGGGGGSGSSSGSGGDGDSGSGTNPPCFVAGTLIDTPNGAKPIEDFRLGDPILAVDVSDMSLVPSVVTGVHIKPKHPERRVKVILTDGREITATEMHPFWNPVRGGFYPISTFGAGYLLHDAELGAVEIDSMTWVGGPADVYNLTVDRYQNYLVDGILVHNICTLP